MCSIDPAFVDAIPNQQKQGLMKTMMNYVGIKTQDTSMPTTAASASASASTTSDYNPASYSSPSTSYNQQSHSNMGMASGVHYMPPRDIQNRKAL
jgi:histidine ammonia-lyase